MVRTCFSESVAEVVIHAGPVVVMLQLQDTQQATWCEQDKQLSTHSLAQAHVVADLRTAPQSNTTQPGMRQNAPQSLHCGLPAQSGGRTAARRCGPRSSGVG